MTGQHLKWKLADFDSLEHWVSDKGVVCLLGDSCHPMMPYMAQGAAQATEDAAAIAAALRRCPTVPEALAMYERARKPRATYIARNTRVLQEWLHLYDGPSRDERDRLMARDSEQNPIFWGWSTRRDWLFRYDASNLNAEHSEIPSLPRMPPDEARVYINRGEQPKSDSHL